MSQVGLDRPSDHRRAYLIVLLTITVLATGWFAMLSALLSLADERMYRAKAEGRDRVVSGTPGSS